MFNKGHGRRTALTLENNSLPVSGSAILAKIYNDSWQSIGTCTFAKRKNGYVTVVGASSNYQTLSAKNWTTVGTLPNGYYPDRDIHFVVDAKGGSEIIMGWVVASEHTIKLYSSGETAYWDFSVVFPISD